MSLLSDEIKRSLLRAIDTRWASRVVRESNLQSAVIEQLKERRYRDTAVAHFACKHGAAAALRIMHMADDEWSLRV